MFAFFLLICLILAISNSYSQFCNSSHCSGHGICFGTPIQPICFCEAGFIGIHCEFGTIYTSFPLSLLFLELCSRTPGFCNGHGLCLGIQSSHICFCEPGYSGPKCEQQNGPNVFPRLPSFRPPIPNSNAKAFSPPESPNKMPTLPTTCSPGQCNERGICVSLENGKNPICICQLGFNGIQCENDLFKKTVDLLQSESLFNGNTSTNLGNNGNSLCSQKDCNNRGICLGIKAKPRCLCDIGFGGQKCELTLLPSMCSGVEKCSGRGICLGTTNWHTCACQSGWTGRKCEETISSKKLKMLKMYWAKFYNPEN